MTTRQINNSSNNSIIFETGDSVGIKNEVSTSSVNKNTSYAVRPDIISQADFSEIKGEKGRVIMISETEEMFYFDNDEWIPLSSNLASNNLGWVLITDTQYTEISPLVLATDVRTKITNNAGTVLDVVGLENGDTIWDSVNNKLQPDNSGDTYDVRFQCTANPSINNRNLQLELDIGGTQGVIWDKTLRLARGANVNTRITETLDIFTLGTFIANGGEFYLTCDGDVDIYDISFKIERKFKYVP